MGAETVKVVSQNLRAICEAARAAVVKVVPENIFQLYMRLSGAPVANLLANRIAPGSHEIWHAACTCTAWLLAQGNV